MRGELQRASAITTAASWQTSQKGTDRNEEVKRRLRMWEAGNIHNVVKQVLGQQPTGRQKQRQRAENNRQEKSAGNAPVN